MASDQLWRPLRGTTRKSTAPNQEARWSTYPARMNGSTGSSTRPRADSTPVTAVDRLPTRRRAQRRRRLARRRRIRCSRPRSGGRSRRPHWTMSPEPDLRYNQFHTTALCSPTRAALLTGRNHHSAHMGTICEIAYGFPGYDSVIPQSTATRRADSAHERLQHCAVRQGALHPDVGDRPRRPVRPLAHRAWIRTLLRFPGRRYLPVRAGALRPDHPG